MRRRPKELATCYRKMKLAETILPLFHPNSVVTKLVKKRTRKHLPMKDNWVGMDKRQFKAIKRARRSVKRIEQNELYVSGELVLEPYKPRNEGKWNLY